MSWTQTQCDQQMSRYGHFSQNKFFFGQLGRLPSFIHDFLWLHDFCTYLYTIFPKTLPPKKRQCCFRSWHRGSICELRSLANNWAAICRRHWHSSLLKPQTVKPFLELSSGNRGRLWSWYFWTPPIIFFGKEKPMRFWDFESLKYQMSSFLCKLLVVLLLCGACLLLKTSTACFDGLKRNLKVGISGKASPFWAFHRSFVPRCAQFLRVVKVRCDANAWRLKWSSAKGRGEKTKRAFAKIWFLRWWRWYWTCLQVFQRVRELFLFSLFWLGWIFAAQHYPGCVADLICVI